MTLVYIRTADRLHVGRAANCEERVRSFDGNTRSKAELTGPRARDLEFDERPAAQATWALAVDHAVGRRGREHRAPRVFTSDDRALRCASDIAIAQGIAIATVARGIAVARRP